MTYIEKFTFEGKAHGPHILLTGMIHGNEPAGEFALKRLIGRLGSHDIELKSGKLTIMPCCNPEAAKAGKRYIDVNLNRIFSDDLIEKNKDSYEAKLAPEIMAAVDECDLAIDFHTFTEHMEPVIMCLDDQNPKTRDLAHHCGLTRVQCDSPHMSGPHTQMLLHYARHKQKPALLLETGQHGDQDAVETAWHCILNILISNQLIDGRISDPEPLQFLVITSALYNREGEKLVFPLMEKDRVNHGDPLFEMNDGTVINADQGGLLFMRNENTPVGEEYAYLCDEYDDWP